MANLTRRTSVLIMGVVSTPASLAKLPTMALTSLTARPRRPAADANKSRDLKHKGFDNDIAKIATNVLMRYLDPQPFKAPV